MGYGNIIQYWRAGKCMGTVSFLLAKMPEFFREQMA